MEIYIDSLEEMCDLMCDNKLPRRKKMPREKKEGWWVFTFGQGQEHYGYIVKIYGTYYEAREKMFNKYGEACAFQYSLKEWGQWLRTKPPYIPEEKVLEVIK